MIEEWRPVSGYEGLYEVSNKGIVRNARDLRALNPYLRGKYPCVTLHKEGKKPRAVHHLVLEAFHGARPDGLVGAHLDGQVSNSALDNLAWVTPAENERHKKAHGTSLHGKRSPQAKFSDFQISVIREINALGVGISRIAALAGVNSSTIHRIVIGERYVSREGDSPVVVDDAPSHPPSPEAVREPDDEGIARTICDVLGFDWDLLPETSDTNRDRRDLISVAMAVWSKHIKAPLAASETALSDALARAERAEKVLTEACRMPSILLMAGEMTAQERRTAQAVANGIAAKVRFALSHPEPVKGESHHGA